ncbi:Phosphoserine phosphatase RsbP [Phycisphaerae bacterium RAS1]|nr:Phosphoserine phosphatase RsbP [Phycisphaerae bacterium RAS1]
MADPQREIQNLRRILDVTRHMATTLDVDALLTMIVEAACEVLGCERATIFLYDKSTDELFTRVGRGVEGIRFPADRGIAGCAAKQRACVNVPDAYADERFNREVDRKTGFRTRNLLTFPLENYSGDLIGVLQALNKHGRPFSADDEALAVVLSAQAGVAIDRGRLIEEYAEKQRMARDLDIARQIQRNLLPKKNPIVEGYEIAGWNQSADETGGDCFDFIPLSDGRLAIILADATGHGIGAALVIAECRSMLRALLTQLSGLDQIVAGVNDLLAHDLADERFVTAFVGILDPKNHRLEYVSGGQAPLLLFSPQGVENRSATAVPLAVIEGMSFEPERFEFEPGAMLVLLTDGFYETNNLLDEQFGEQRVEEHIRGNIAAPLNGLITGLHEKIRAFNENRSQADDLTAVLVRRRAQ